MLFLCPVFTRDKTKGHDYKIVIVLKCVHLFSSKKGGIAWDFSVSCLLCIHLVSVGIPWWLRWLKKNLPAMRKTQGKIPLEKGMSTHSAILAWGIPWTVEPGGLQSMGSQRVGHD